MKSPSLVRFLGAAGLLVVLPSLLHAQPVRLGVQAGPGFFSLNSGDDYGLRDTRTGLTAGGVVGHEFAPGLEAETGLWWVEKGARGELQGFEEAINADVTLKYLQVPLLLRYAIPAAWGGASPFLLAGPAVAFEVGCRERRDVSVLASLVDCDGSPRQTVDLGLILGGGFGWNVGPGRLLVDGRYDLGLSDIDSGSALQSRNRGFYLTTGFSLVPTG